MANLNYCSFFSHKVFNVEWDGRLGWFEFLNVLLIVRVVGCFFFVFLGIPPAAQ